MGFPAIRLRSPVTLVLVVAVAGCAPTLPAVRGAPATSSSAGALWRPPPPDRIPAPAPADPRAGARPLSLVDFVDLALSSSPTTRVTWNNARAAAATYGSARGEWFPRISAEADVIKLQTGGTQGRSAVKQTLYGPSASFTWLLLDVGGRTGRISVAREALIAANWTHNAAIQDAVLQVGQAFYSFAANRALVQAERTNLAEADSNLVAAEERRRVGVATIADVLSARTAVEQARLALQQAEGDLTAARGTLAVRAGYPANAAFEVDSLADAAPIGVVSDSVEALLELAMRERPDLAAAAAQVQQADAAARVARAARLPAITATGNLGRTYLSGVVGPHDTYTFLLGLSVPLFNGFGWDYDARAAQARAEAQAARAELLGQQASLSVFTDYYALRTATERVRTAEALLASALQAAEAAGGRYRAGVGTLLELVTAENTLASARAQRIQARFAWRTALLQLAHDAGVLDPQGASRINVTSDSSRNGPPR